MMSFTEIIFTLMLCANALAYDDYDDIDYEDYKSYDDAYTSSPADDDDDDHDEETINRVKRFQAKSSPKTLSPNEILEVKAAIAAATITATTAAVADSSSVGDCCAIKNMLSGMGIDNPFTPYTSTEPIRFPSTLHANTTTFTPSEGDVTLDTVVDLSETTASATLRNVFTKFEDASDTSATLSFRDKEFLRKWGLWKKKKTIHTTYTSTVITRTTEKLTRRTLPPEKALNVPALMKIIANLTGDFETNLTRRLNETLSQMSLPTCGTPTLPPPVTSEYDANYTGSLVAKCFVCGLDVRQIPRNAHCADAFAGDFLPLVPVDPTARAHISKYRKYCTYSNNPGYTFNETRPRAIFGRWTGGCAVRWIDMSGIYTQRVCRNRMQPTMGRHFASKRMAKLEKTLWNVDNGCIISPMATLVPMSRGISLYARFHACVCTGSWCNRAVLNTQWIINNISMILGIFTIT